MAVLASDSFTRSDNAALGANWGTVSGQGSYGIATNTALWSGGGEAANRYTAVAASANQYSKVKLTTIRGVTDEGPGPAVRMASAANTMYFAQCNTVEIKLYKVVANTFTQLGSDAAAAAANDVIELDANGTSITVKKNGSTIIGPITDSAISSGDWGIYGAAGTIAVDDWEGGDFSGASAYTKGNFLAFM